MTPEDAEEYTQSLGQIVAGSWRQIAWAQKMGIPQALKLTTEEWVKQRLGGYIRLSLKERPAVVADLKADGLSNRQIASVLGVTSTTVDTDVRAAKNLALDPSDQGETNGLGARNLAAKEKDFYTLEEWHALSAKDRAQALAFSGGAHKFNTSDSDEGSTQSIEWARSSWNPVTGCRHSCPYCYARDIAEAQRMRPLYPMQFEPAFRYKRLADPGNTSVPSKADTDVSYRNVFTCSMADLFGRWVPREWIEAVLSRVAANPQWKFLFLTKFAARLTEFSFPENAWVGTTVDCQARVKAAEQAFAKVDASVKWLSVEPMLEPLKFQHLERFDWIVIGGASRSSQTPEWRVPIEWWAPLYQQAADLGLAIYLKSNLYERARGYPGVPWKAPQTPAEFIYLKTKSKDDIVLGEKS